MIQCVYESNVGNKNAAFGCFEDMMSKIGNILFRVQPCLPHARNIINTEKCWFFGLDVSHNANKPSVCMLVLQTKPLEGTMRGVRCSAHLNKNRVEIVPFAAMTTMVFRLLMNAWKGIINGRKELLPKNIFVFRDGVSDGELNEVLSKEVVGFQRGIKLAKESMRVAEWKPKLEFIVVCKSPIDKFGILDRNGTNVYDIEYPCVVFNGITSQKLWDFFIYPFHPKKRSATKPLRYIVLKDGMQLSKKIYSNAPWDLFQLIHASLYTYSFAIPFSMGGTSQPAPIKYAKHYAETFAQMILDGDRTLSDLQLATNLRNRPHIIEQLVNLPDLTNGNGNDTATNVSNRSSSGIVGY